MIFPIVVKFKSLERQGLALSHSELELLDFAVVSIHSC